MNEFEKVLIDSQKEVGKSNKRKDKIIVLLIVLMFLEAIVGYSGFIWYESQFDYVTTEQETQDVDLSTEGDNANAEYNDVQGMIKGALRDVHEHLEEQDDKIDHIIELLVS